MRYLSLFSGIEAVTQAWKPLGWECVAVSEIEPFPCAVLEHHYPDIPNLGDVTKITEDQIKALGHIDLVVFGSPCQNLSVAGNRKGLKGDQSSLFYAAMEVIRYAREHCGLRFALWENVPGAFSSNKGADFSAVVEQMAGLEDIGVPKNGWGKEGAAVGVNGLLEWSVLDAQFFGLAQRRKRVFALLDFGNWRSRPPILLERESLRGDTPPSRETRQNTTTDVKKGSARSINFRAFGAKVESELVGTLTATDYKEPQGVLRNQAVAIAGNIIGRSHQHGGNGNGFDDTGACYTLTTADRHAVAFKVRGGCKGGGKGYLGSDETAFTVSTVQDQQIFEQVTYSWNGDHTPKHSKEVCMTMRAGQGGEGLGVAYAFSPGIAKREGNPNRFIEEKTPTLAANMGTNQVATAYSIVADATPKVGTEINGTLRSQGGGGIVPPSVAHKSVVRRLTPIECERLQGFPDNYTQIPYRNKPADKCPKGPRYKALGNSMSVPVMFWIGKKLQEAVAWRENENSI